MRLCIGNAHNAGADVFHNFVPAAEIRTSPKPVYAGRLGGVKSAVDPPAGKSRVLMLPARSFSRKHPEPCPTSLKITCWRVWPAVAALLPRTIRGPHWRPPNRKRPRRG